MLRVRYLVGLVFKLNKDTKDKALDLFLCSLLANQLEHYREITGI